MNIKDAINNTNSMSEAARLLGIPYTTFRRKAIKLGLNKPNQAGKGISKSRRNGHGKIPLNEILEGKHPSYHRGHLIKRILKNKLLEYRCTECGNIGDW